MPGDALHAGVAHVRRLLNVEERGLAVVIGRIHAVHALGLNGKVEVAGGRVNGNAFHIGIVCPLLGGLDVGYVTVYVGELIEAAFVAHAPDEVSVLAEAEAGKFHNGGSVEHNPGVAAHYGHAGLVGERSLLQGNAAYGTALRRLLGGTGRCFPAQENTVALVVGGVHVGVPDLGAGTRAGVAAVCVDIAAVREPRLGVACGKSISGGILPALFAGEGVGLEENGDVLTHGNLISRRAGIVLGLGGAVAPNRLVHGGHPGAVVGGEGGGVLDGLVHGHGAGFLVFRALARERILAAPLVQKAVRVSARRCRCIFQCAQVAAHHGVPGEVVHLGAYFRLGNPDVPAPENLSVLVLGGHQGVAGNQRGGR